MQSLPPDIPQIRNLKQPITKAQLGPLDPLCECVQFSEPLSDREYKRVAKFMRRYPHVKLRAYTSYGPGFDLEFLRHFPTLRRFQVDMYNLPSLAGLRHLPDDLEVLCLGQSRSQRLSLSVLERFQNLKELWLEKHKKHIEVLGQIKSLEDLRLRSITLPDLSLLRPLTELRSFSLKLGGTNDLSLLPEIGHLRYLEIWMVRGLTDLSMLSHMHELQYLFLQTLKHVRELPSFAQHVALRRVILQGMKGISDLSTLAEAPCLEELALIEMPHLQPEAVQPLAGHPTLRDATFGLGSDRKNQAARQIFGLPDSYENLPPFQYR